jgi:hypothetical protein
LYWRATAGVTPIVSAVGRTGIACIGRAPASISGVTCCARGAIG